MTGKPKPKRDERGQFMPKWGQELRGQFSELNETQIAESEAIIGTSGRVTRLEERFDKLSERLGTSTPLIIWNIAVLIAIAYLYCKAYVPGTP